ncbi:MAG: hypothetical protein LWX56_08180 [Ignavibacteria bacterium]|nr:hypothetical protein [Ignavibacteria bacterium]
MIQKIIQMVILCGFLLPVFGQNLDELLDQVDLKLRKDKRYLNINYVVFPNNKIGEELKNLPRLNYREPISFKAADNITYNIVFLKEAVGIDSLVLLYVDQITDRSQGDNTGMFSATGGPQSDTVKALNFKDLYNLQRVRPEAYKALLTEVNRFIRENPDQQPSSLLKILPDEDIKTSLGVASRDNTDYLNYMRANYMHWYPKAKVEKKGKRGAAVATADSINYRIEAGFSRFTFSHRSMDFSLGGASIELGTSEKVLNLVPYQSMAVTGGFRTLVNIAQKKEDIDKSFIIDARLLVRLSLNSESMAKVPFAMVSSPKLMVGNAAGLDVTLTRPFGLPVINLFVMTGSEPSLKNPPMRLVNKDGKYVAYYNISSLEGSMSFFWNTSETMTSRFRLDVGAGYYDVHEAQYTSAYSSTIGKSLIQDDFYPMIALHFNFAPGGADIFGAMIKTLDSQVKAEGWLKVMELEGGHVFRFAAAIVSPPLAREKRLWESDGGALVEVRYRYGF